MDSKVELMMLMLGDTFVQRGSVQITPKHDMMMTISLFVLTIVAIVQGSDWVVFFFVVVFFCKKKNSSLVLVLFFHAIQCSLP